MKKLLVFGVIVLFLGVAIAPSINADIIEIESEPTTDDYDMEFIFLGFIRSFEIGIEGNWSYLYICYICTLKLYYHKLHLFFLI